MTISIVDVLDRKHVRSTILAAFKKATEQYHNGCCDHDVDVASGRRRALSELAFALGLEELVLV